MAEILEKIVLVLLVIYYWLESIVLFFLPRHLYFKDVKNEIVLITGGGSGIGRLLALKFSKLGAKVIVWDINKESCEETAKLVKEQGGTAFSFTVDITDSKLVYSTAAEIKKTIGKVTFLINNAGIVYGKKLEDLQDEQIKKTMDVNVLSHFWTIKAFLPDMKADNHGHIVCMASVAGLVGVSRAIDYCASKFANVGFMESLNFELLSEGYDRIYTTTICPIFIKTGMFEGANPGVFDWLDPEYVSERIVTAVRNNQTIVYIPRLLYTLYALRVMMPWKSFIKFRELFGKEDSAMRDFVGRFGKDK